MLFSGHAHKVKDYSPETILGSMSPDISGFKGSYFEHNETHRFQEYPNNDFFKGWNIHLHTDREYHSGFQYFHLFRELLYDIKVIMQNPEIPYKIIGAIENMDQDVTAQELANAFNLKKKKVKENVRFFYNTVWLYESIMKMIIPRRIINRLSNL